MEGGTIRQLVEGRQGHCSGAVGSEPAVLMLIQVSSNPFNKD